MKENNGNKINNWFFNNSWAMIVILAGFIAAFAALQIRVSINTGIIYALQEKVNAYPSEQYFNLRFNNIEESLAEVKTDLKAHLSN
jgi:hypothetical protein